MFIYTRSHIIGTLENNKHLCVGALQCDFLTREVHSRPQKLRGVQCDSHIPFSVGESNWNRIHKQVGFEFATYHTLRNADIVGGRGGHRLVRSAGVSQNGQLLDALDATLTETAKLHPICSHRLVGVDHKVVPFTWRDNKHKHYKHCAH